MLGFVVSLCYKFPFICFGGGYFDWCEALASCVFVWSRAGCMASRFLPWRWWIQFRLYWKDHVGGASVVMFVVCSHIKDLWRGHSHRWFGHWRSGASFGIVRLWSRTRRTWRAHSQSNSTFFLDMEMALHRRFLLQSGRFGFLLIWLCFQSLVFSLFYFVNSYTLEFELSWLVCPWVSSSCMWKSTHSWVIGVLRW